MLHKADVKIGKVELIFESRPDKMSITAFEKEYKRLGNEIHDIKDGAIINRSEYDLVMVGEIVVDHSPVPDGALVWSCDFCGMYSRSKLLVDKHEENCQERKQ